MKRGKRYQEAAKLRDKTNLYDAPEYTGRLCVIGSKLKEDKLAELFGLA